jgi:hypothetical protein
VSAVHKIGVLVVPWLFVGVFATLYALFLLPRMSEGHLVTLCMGSFVALVFASFFVAAITFSLDVLSGRWPE